MEATQFWAEYFHNSRLSTNCRLVTKDGQFKATHQLILASVSRFMETLLLSVSDSATEEVVIILPDFSLSQVEQLLEAIWIDRNIGIKCGLAETLIILAEETSKLEEEVIVETSYIDTKETCDSDFVNCLMPDNMYKKKNTREVKENDVEHDLSIPYNVNSRSNFPLDEEGPHENPIKTNKFPVEITSPELLEDIQNLLACENCGVIEADKSSHQCTCPNKRCHKSFKRKGDLVNHLMMHKVRYTCEVVGCSKKYGSNDSLKRHMSGEHLIFKCNRCPYVTEGKNIMRKHEKNHDVKKTTYVCPICQKDGSRKNRSHHMKTHLKKTNPILTISKKNCKFCFKLVSKKNFSRHEGICQKQSQSLRDYEEPSRSTSPVEKKVNLTDKNKHPNTTSYTNDEIDEDHCVQTTASTYKTARTVTRDQHSNITGETRDTFEREYVMGGGALVTNYVVDFVNS